MPQFAHLPLILKPSGKGKLSKRDGAKFGFPVFPLNWFETKEDQLYEGFKEAGFLPESVINFLALLGWNPGNDEELFSIEQLNGIFSLDKINKAGAQFNYDKAIWFNQHYIKNAKPIDILSLIASDLPDHIEDSTKLKVIEMLQPRVEFLSDFKSQSSYFWEAPEEYDKKPLRKKYKPENSEAFESIISLVKSSESTSESLAKTVKGYITDNELKFGAILPVLRIWMTGSMAGPDLFEMMALLGSDETVSRLERGHNYCNKSIE